MGSFYSILNMGSHPGGPQSGGWQASVWVWMEGWAHYFLTACTSIPRAMMYTPKSLFVGLGGWMGSVQLDCTGSHPNSPQCTPNQFRPQASGWDWMGGWALSIPFIYGPNQGQNIFQVMSWAQACARAWMGGWAPSVSFV